jgi:hypothetical protein
MALKIHSFNPDFNRLQQGLELLTRQNPISMFRAAFKGAGGFFANFDGRS